MYAVRHVAARDVVRLDTNDPYLVLSTSAGTCWAVDSELSVKRTRRSGLYFNQEIYFGSEIMNFRKGKVK